MSEKLDWAMKVDPSAVHPKSAPIPTDSRTWPAWMHELGVTPRDLESARGRVDELRRARATSMPKT